MLGERNTLETGLIILTNSSAPSQRYEILESFFPDQNILP